MTNPYPLAARAAHFRRTALAGGALLLALLPGGIARAQAPTPAPTWQDAFSGNANQPTFGSAVARATAVDAAGNVFVTGSFLGQVTFGSSRLVGAGGGDVFLAKWDATANAWAWAVAGGGTGADAGYGLAVSGGEVYVTGAVTNSGTANASTAQAVQFGGTPLFSASNNATANTDVFVLRYTDGATAPTYRWATAGGGTGPDAGQSIGVSGGEVYATGSVTNSGSTRASTAQAVQFGGAALFSAGTTATANTDVFVLRYTDGATAPTYRWATAGGGTGPDAGNGLAVSGSEVYVTGAVTNGGTRNATSNQGVQFEGTPLFSASNTATANTDVFVLRYTDGATAPTYRWATAGGGTGVDAGIGLAVSGGEVYVTGQVANSGTARASTGQAVQFGGAALFSASSSGVANADAFAVRYTDDLTTPTYRWAVAGGGIDADAGRAIAVSGGEVYVTGSVTNSGTRNATTTQLVQFGGTALFSAGTTTTANADVFVLRYTDDLTTPAYRWATAGGDTGTDTGYGVAVSGSRVWVAASTGSVVGRFGSLLTPANAAVLGQLEAGTGSWQRAEVALQGGSSQVRATAVDAAGNVFVTGNFDGQVGFGSSQLVSAGGADVFLAKWDATARAWAWAVAGGGTGNDAGYGLAVSGSEVYVSGFVSNSGTRNASSNQGVQFGGTPLFSASTIAASNTDVLVLHYTDGGTAPIYRWAVAGGGTQGDNGNAIAVSGGEVYVTGSVSNSGTLNASSNQGVRFGGTLLFSASTTSFGNPDAFVVHYTDGATAPTYRWATAGGGTQNDGGFAIAVNGDEVYVTGSVTNAGTVRATTDLAVQFGGTPLFSASTSSSWNADVFVAHYTAGATAPTYRWATAGGGSFIDVGQGIAVSGSEIYVTGYVANKGTLNASTTQPVQFDGVPLFSASTTNVMNYDVFLLRYTDGLTAPTHRWAIAGGGTNNDVAQGIAVKGSEVYVTGYVSNSGVANTSTTEAVQFGGTPLFSASTKAAANNDVFVLRYTDGATAPTYRWALAGGGMNEDISSGIALSGDNVVVAGTLRPAATFGSTTLANPAGQEINFVARVTESATPPPASLMVSTGTLAAPTAVPAGTYTTLTVTGTGVAELKGDVAVTTAVTVQSGGVLLTNCQPLTGPGSFTLAAGATLGICDPAGISGSGSTGAVQTATRDFAADATYLYNGTVAQATGSGLPATVRELALNNAAGLTLSQPVQLTQRVLLTLGDLTLGGQALTLRSDASGTALVANLNGRVLGATATMQRHIETNPAANGYRHYASPMAPVAGAETLATLATAGYTPDFSGAADYNSSATPNLVTPFPTVFLYNQDRGTGLVSTYGPFDKGWQAALGTELPQTGRGYAVQAPGTALVDFTGTLVSGSVSRTNLERASTDPATGWHLLGNPFPSPLDWSTMSVGTTVADNLQNMDGAVYVFQSSGPYAGSYRTYLASAPGTDSPLIPAGAGFFVHTTSPTTPGIVRFNPANRVTTFGAQPAFGRGTAEGRARLTLALRGATGLDAMTVYADPAATAALDARYDAVKLSNPTGLNLSARTGADNLAINGLPTFATATVPLNVGVPAAGSYALQVSELANLPAGTTAVLVDTERNTRTDLATLPAAGYAFSVTATQATALLTDRFYLSLSGAVLTTAPGQAASALTLYPNPAHSAATLTGAQPGAVVTVFDALGRPVATATANAAGTAALVLPAALPAGMYVVRAGAQTVRLVRE